MSTVDFDQVLQVEMRAEPAFRLRWVLPLIVEAVGALSDNNEFAGLVDEACQALDAALPPEIRALIDEEAIAEKRMDVIDRQREAGVRPTGGDKGEAGSNG